MDTLKILRSRIPVGGYGRPLTRAEIGDIRRTGQTVSNAAIVQQDRADYRGVVYNPSKGGGYAHSGIIVETAD